MPETIVLAFGGNAIIKSKEKGTWDEQWNNIRNTCRHVTALVKKGYKIVITHGNGPQVGNLLLKNEIAKDIVPPMPLDVCVSNTQGSLGYALSQILGNYLRQEGLDIPVAALVTQVVVDGKDPAFQNPTKFVGPFFSAEEAQKIMAEKSHIMKEDSGRGWRRVVPSPEPVEILEKDIIKRLLDSGTIIIAAGGGGIPVTKENGWLEGVEAVIDKDMAGQLLARDIDADALFLLTEVDRVCIHYGKPEQREISRMDIAEARRYQQEGHFPAGSMGPKMEAAIRFAASGAHRRSVIVSLENADKAFSGESGTIITA